MNDDRDLCEDELCVMIMSSLILIVVSFQGSVTGSFHRVLTIISVCHCCKTHSLNPSRSLHCLQITSVRASRPAHYHTYLVIRPPCSSCMQVQVVVFVVFIVFIFVCLSFLLSFFFLYCCGPDCGCRNRTRVACFWWGDRKGRAP